MWKIGNVEIKNKVVLAPMAGVCNSAFRRIIKDKVVKTDKMKTGEGHRPSFLFKYKNNN